ncbi:hypothetical protein EHV15_32770 [Paenibacillus oralis]|uniref:Uncharacterized protein n=1 Tax=Paenibacillus oralis TaxID=2490856 RepID=A0A3P3UBV8_9BACL|nr:hypothetical protein [Paenibacillus oralis]RRJ67166.1 hypothetical protein EHV15_32770 [Paenibacillus oralis]
MKKISFNEMKENHTSFFSPNQLVVRKLPVISTTDEEQIREILINMINIQGILARHYFYQRELGSSNIEDYSFFITNKVDDEALMFSMIFDSVTVTKTRYGEPCNLQVNNAKDIAYKVFESMIKEKQVNNEIGHFILGRKFQNDYRQLGCFEIEGDEGEVIENEFFTYLIKSSSLSTAVYPAYLDVSGLKMEEIDKDQLIIQLANQVSKLYLMVYDYENTEGVPFFRKELRWFI